MKQPIWVKLKSWLSVGLVLIGTGILFPLLMIEVAAHIVPGLIPSEVKTSIFQIDPPYRVLSPDRELGYKFSPDIRDYPVSLDDKYYTISTVSLGYEGIGFRDDGLAGRRTYAVVVGDSFANCAGVELEACWVELLEQGRDQDFANLSVLGYGPQQEACMLMRYGLPLEPELVLWVFFANDVKDAWRFDHFGSGAAREAEFWQSPVRTWLVENSAVYAFWAFFWYNRYFFYNLLTAGENTGGQPNLNWWLAITDLTTPEVAEGFTLTKDAILTAYQQTLLRNPEANFVVVILPFREQVYAGPELQDRFDRLNGQLVDFLQQHEIPVIDLTAELRIRAHQEPEPLYYREDIHLNVRGNEVVTELLQEHLLEILDQ